MRRNRYRFGRRSKQHLASLKSDTVKLCHEALRWSDIDFGIIDSLRTAEQQNALYKKGRSSLDGYRRKSDHQAAFAVDILPIVKDKHGRRLDPWNVSDIRVRDAWSKVHHAFQRAAFKLGFVIEFGTAYRLSGGKDYPHISLKGLAPKRFGGLK